MGTPKQDVIFRPKCLGPVLSSTPGAFTVDDGLSELTFISYKHSAWPGKHTVAEESAAPIEEA